jgi:fido (protein-threonine AMPylation protein)
MTIAKCKICKGTIITTQHLDKSNAKCYECSVEEFLKESNFIEGEYSGNALKDAKQAWSMACICSKDFNEKEGVSYTLGIHRRLMKRLNPEIAGKIRDKKVYVGSYSKGFKECLDHTKIREELNKLLVIKPKNEEEIKDWHIQFESIHPFEDGNGRTGRILMNIQRLRINLPLLIIHTGIEQENYYKWFRGEKNV